MIKATFTYNAFELGHIRIDLNITSYIVFDETEAHKEFKILVLETAINTNLNDLSYTSIDSVNIILMVIITNTLKTTNVIKIRK